ncbi:MAG: ABC transporter substrate-binding protein [Flavobacteriaceae bacterium]|nr:ABC transporter substrate-binding protein [Flavobacteriaceae bacterium]
MNLKLKLFFLATITLIFSCKNEPKPENINSTDKATVKKNKYAKGFEITDFNDYKILSIRNPWPKAEKTYKFALIQKDMLSKFTLNKNEFDGFLTIPIEKIVVTSTTHIPALELLEIEESLIGFPGTDYVSSEKTRVRINNGNIRELGKNEGINTEVLLELKPDVVVGFGVDGNNKTFETIKNSGIPVIYNGDWVEDSPLAKAEWIKFFGVLYDKEKEADSIFNQIESDYLEAKETASIIKNKPTVLSGAMHKDVWYLPSGTSPEAQLLNDANVNYLWSDTSGSGSLALSFESVFEKGKNADLWLSPSYYSSFEALGKANEHYTKFDAFKNRNIFTFANTTGETGGVLYYELGTARPDLVLKDLIKICHPELLKDYIPHFFKPLQ